MNIFYIKRRITTFSKRIGIHTFTPSFSSFSGYYKFACKHPFAASQLDDLSGPSPSQVQTHLHLIS